MMVCQISRGIAPCVSIWSAMDACQELGYHYMPIYGKPCVDAKNDAVMAALLCEDDLLLVEDDILADLEVWDAASRIEGMAVAYASCRMRNGEENVMRRREGDFLFAGTVFVVVPNRVLTLLPTPPFEARRYVWSREHDNYIPADYYGYNLNIGSDRDFWYKVQNINPSVSIRHLGRVRHLKHPLNLEWNLNNPYTIEEW